MENVVRIAIPSHVTKELYEASLGVGAKTPFGALDPRCGGRWILGLTHRALVPGSGFEDYFPPAFSCSFGYAAARPYPPAWIRFVARSLLVSWLVALSPVRQATTLASGRIALPTRTPSS